MKQGGQSLFGKARHFLFSNLIFFKLAAAENFRKSARIPPLTPPPRGQNAKNKLVSVLRKSKSPENSFRKTESELKPRHTA